MATRAGDELGPAIDEAWRVIHDNDVERLAQLIEEHPALLTWRGSRRHPNEEWEGDGGVLGFATGAYGDAFDPARERSFTRAACAELLIDAGAVVLPYVPESILQSRARALLQLFQRKNLLPHTLKYLAALDDRDAVRALLENTDDAATVGEAFICACRFHNASVASLLLDRAIVLDGELRRRVEDAGGGPAFIKYFLDNGADARVKDAWLAFVKQRLMHAIRDGDLAAFVAELERSPWLGGEAFVDLQVELIQQAAFHGGSAFITAVLDRDPALLRRRPPPPTKAFEHALTYAHTDVIPLLTRIWPLPDDLPTAAGLGDVPRVLHHLQSTAPHPQRTLDTALAYAVLNHHFAVADRLLERGADINTDWNSHEPASILHTLVFEDDYQAMQYLIDRGIDMTIEDYRWQATAEGWARYGKHDPAMADWLEQARLRRGAR